MLPKVFSRLSGKPDFVATPGGNATAPERPPAAAAEAPPAAAPPPAPSKPTAPIAAVAPILVDPSIHDEVEAGTDVRRWLRTALATLEQEMDPSELRGDAQAFFERISRSGEKTVRQPPAAAQRALELTRQEVAVSALVRLVEQDPVLAQSLLRFANSSMYTTGGRSTSLAECIRRVGTQGLRSVILSSMVEGTLCRSGSAYDNIVRQVWEHMVRTAPLARALAPGFGVIPDEAFTLALLHDVGKLVVFDRLGTLRTELRREVKLGTDSAAARVARTARSARRCGSAALGSGQGRRWGDRDAPSPQRHARCESAHGVRLPRRAPGSGSGAEHVPVDLPAWFAEGKLTANFDAISPLVESAGGGACRRVRHRRTDAVGRLDRRDGLREPADLENL